MLRASYMSTISVSSLQYVCSEMSSRTKNRSSSSPLCVKDSKSVLSVRSTPPSPFPPFNSPQIPHPALCTGQRRKVEWKGRAGGLLYQQLHHTHTLRTERGMQGHGDPEPERMRNKRKETQRGRDMRLKEPCLYV